jgi:hypothetical protein
MLQRQYFYFVAGLADLLFDSGKSFAGMLEFREELKKNLHPRDFHLVSLLFLPYDNKNLINFLEGSGDAWDQLGNFSKEDFEEQLRIIRAILKEEDILPDYIARIMREWNGLEEGMKVANIKKRLSEGYVNTVEASGNKFLKRWIRFEKDLNNIFIFLNAKSLGIDPAAHMVGDDPFTCELLDLFRSGKDFSVSFEEDYVSDIFKIATESEFLERERKIDLLKWNFIDTITFFEYFNIDLILAYLVKYSIVLRWDRLNPETGREMLQKFITETESSISSRVSR